MLHHNQQQQQQQQQPATRSNHHSNGHVKTNGHLPSKPLLSISVSAFMLPSF
jgi:hypothetical protein